MRTTINALCTLIQKTSGELTVAGYRTGKHDDESTTDLDPRSRIELWETIDLIRNDKNMILFLTTHYMEEAEHADRVAIMDKGSVRRTATPQSLKTAWLRTRNHEQVCVFLVLKINSSLIRTMSVFAMVLMR